MHYPLNAYDVLLNMTPWFHRGGVHVGGPLPHLLRGGPAPSSPQVFQPKLSLQTIEAVRGHLCHGRPSLPGDAVPGPGEEPVDLSKLRGLITMGGPL